MEGGNINVVVCRSDKAKRAETEVVKGGGGCQPGLYSGSGSAHLCPLATRGGWQHLWGIGHWGCPEPWRRSMVRKHPVPCVPPRPVQDKESMRQVMRAVDKANGYSFGDQEHRSLEALMSAAVGADFQFTSYPSPATLLCAESGFLSAGGGGAGCGGRLVQGGGSG